MLIILFEPVLSRTWIFSITNGSGFLKIRKPNNLLFQFLQKFSEPTFSFLKDPERTTCYAEGYLISSKIF
jgi:hypothetical protein